MDAPEALGYVASAAVLATFCMRDMGALRATAIASNVAFIAYGALAAVHPVLLLHLVLLPINAHRLLEALRTRRARVAAAARPACVTDARREQSAAARPDARRGHDPERASLPVRRT